MKLIKELDALVEASTNVAEGHDEDDEKNPFDELEYGKEYPKDKIQSMIDHGYAEVQSGDIDNPRRAIQLLNLDTRETQMIYVKEASQKLRYHVVSKLDGWVLASYATREEALKAAGGNPVVSGELETVGDHKFVKEAFKLGDKVKIVAGAKDAIGKEGVIGEIRSGPYKGAPKEFTVDYDYDEITDRSKSIRVSSAQIRALKEAAYADDLDPNAPVVVTGVKGMASKPFKKKFKNMDAYDAWCDSEEAGDCEVHKVINEDAAESHRSNIEVIASVDGLMVLCDGKNFSLRSGGKRHAKISHDDWAHLAAAVKNRVTVTVGNMTLEPHADSWELKDSSGKSFASLDASEIDGLMAGVDAHLKKAHVDSDTAHSVKEDTHEDHETGATDSDGIADYDRGEYDREGDMAHTQLHTICAASQDLLEMIDAEDNLPEWVQSKLTLAQDYLTTVRDYLAAKKHDHAAE